jgi:peptidase E
VTRRHIVPFGGLRPQPGRVHPIIEYLLGLTGKPRARVAIIPTAMGDAAEALVNLYARFPAERTERSHLALFHRTIDDIDAYLLDQDIILVASGSREPAGGLADAGVDRALRVALDAGIILTGAAPARSAGSRAARPTRSISTASPRSATALGFCRAATARTTTARPSVDRCITS